MGMKKRTVAWKLAELDRILNDPTTPMEPHRVWSLLDDISAGGVAEETGRPTLAKSSSRVLTGHPD